MYVRTCDNDAPEMFDLNRKNSQTHPPGANVFHRIGNVEQTFQSLSDVDELYVHDAHYDVHV